VIVGDQFELTEFHVRANGYGGAYAIGTNTYSKEPLALATKDGDRRWADFVNWVLQGLIVAEERGYTQSDAFKGAFGKTNLFGDEYEDMFNYALREEGNYGEIYSRHLEPLIPRNAAVMNQINLGDSGLIYSMPFGLTDTTGPELIEGGTMATILDCGFLRCGISARAMFAETQASTKTWTGFDVDFCHAIAAALFDGGSDKIQFEELSGTERFLSLENGDVDVLSRITTVNFPRDVKENTSQAGFSFSQPNFYDGLSFGGIPAYVKMRCSYYVTYSSFVSVAVPCYVQTMWITNLATVWI
jgi:hypothetical protein